MRGARALRALVVALTMVAACSPPTSPLELGGIYVLKTVNGAPLPYVLSSDGHTTVEVLEDRFILKISGTYSETGYKRHTSAGAVSITIPVDGGSFTRRGSDVTLESFFFGYRPATIVGSTLTLVEQGLTLVYLK